MIILEKARQVKTPSYVIDELKLVKNLEILQDLSKQTGCKVLLAQKAFSMFSVYPLIGEYLDGTTASGLYEARLSFEYMKKENHVFSPVYQEREFDEILSYCDHVVFNSFRQWEKYREKALATGKSCGMRVNPECSTQEQGIYDPCSPYSRLGVTKANFQKDLIEGLEGLHFHTLCEQNADALEITLAEVERLFGAYLHDMKWINFGGGHHITRDGYDLDKLKRCITHIQEKYDLKVYLEPGEAVVLRAGYLVAEVLEIVENEKKIAILNASAACHMPDVLEMPYRPPVLGSGFPGEKPHSYLLAGNTCLAGDVIGEYSFDQPLKEGDQIILEDMALYTMVKNNTFNGIKLPSISLLTQEGDLKVMRSFGYQDFKERLS